MVVPPKANAEFVWRMEDVLEVYTRPYDLRYPQICMDEVSKQLLRDTCGPLPMEPGWPERRDYEYQRGWVVNLFSVWLNIAEIELSVLSR